MRVCKYYIDNQKDKEGAGHPVRGYVYPEKEIKKDGDGNLIVTRWAAAGAFNPYGDMRLMDAVALESEGEDVQDVQDVFVVFRTFIKPATKKRAGESDDDLAARHAAAVQAVLKEDEPVMNGMSIKVGDAIHTRKILQAARDAILSVPYNPAECVSYGTCPLYKQCHGCDAPIA